MRLWRAGRFRGANVALDSTPESLSDLAVWGANFVRVTLDDNLVETEPPYGLKESGIRQVDALLTAARSVGLKVVLSLQAAPGRRAVSDRRIWEQPECHLAFARIWKQIAARYRENPSLVGYDLLSEPNPELAYTTQTAEKVAGTTADWNLLAKRLTLAIRDADPYRPVIVESTAWAYARGFVGLKPTGDPNTIYSFHMYSPHKFTHQDAGKPISYPGFVPAHVEPAGMWDVQALQENLKPALRFGERYKVPIYVGEFGVVRTAPGAEKYIRDLMLIFEAYGWHWSFWGYGGAADWNPEFGPQPAALIPRSPARAPLLQSYRDFLALNDHPSLFRDLPLLQDDFWVESMRAVHSRFSGTPGTVGLFGDSITHGHQFFSPLFTGAYVADDKTLGDLHRFRESVPALVADWKSPAHGNRSGWRITDALPGLPAALANDNPEVALVMFGTNDMNDGPPDRTHFPEHLRSYLQAVLENGTVPILSTLPPKKGFGNRIEFYNQVIRRTSRELNVPLVDFYGAVLRRRPTGWYRTLIIGDGVHPSFPDGLQRDMREVAGLRESGFTLRNFLALEAVIGVQDRIRAND